CTVLAQLRPRLGGGRCGPRRWLGGLLGKVHASLRVNPPATQTSWLVSIGSLRMRLPVSLNKALVSAGITGGNAGSPMPVGALSDLTNSTWIFGVEGMRGTSYSWKFVGLAPPFSISTARPTAWPRPSMIEP